MDERQQIFKKIALDNGYCTDKSVVVIEDDLKLIYEAMDEYMKATCLELLEYMANNEVSCEVNIAKEKRFYFKGQWISKEELFENFL